MIGTPREPSLLGPIFHGLIASTKRGARDLARASTVPGVDPGQTVRPFGPRHRYERLKAEALNDHVPIGRSSNACSRRRRRTSS